MAATFKFANYRKGRGITLLVLSRKKNETVVIQDHIEITILGVEGDTVRLGISAPKHVDIFRKEVYLSIQESNLEAVVPAPEDLMALLNKMRRTSE